MILDDQVEREDGTKKKKYRERGGGGKPSVLSGQCISRIPLRDGR